jgi:NAD(P)-dependent dehydrogenase (short-subunit alcohol dehydrogenase family)
VQKLLPPLTNGGSIILNGSVGSVKGTPGFGVYGATKAALRSFVRTWTSDLRDRHVRSNVISPGQTDTPIVDGNLKTLLRGLCPPFQWGGWEILTKLLMLRFFLASDDSSFVTGIELFVDGGRGQV